MRIFHIAKKEIWESALKTGSYQPQDFKKEGFIHCSKRNQVLSVANHRFAATSGLILLEIKSDRVKSEIKFENLEGGETLFPHIYGPLEITAVSGIYPFKPSQNGTFSFPETETHKLLYNQIDECTWEMLAPHFARGVVIVVDRTLEFIETALAITEDDAPQVRAWTEAGLLVNASTDHVQLWKQVPEKRFQMVITAPYVLIQELLDS